MAAAEDHIQDLCEEAVCPVCLDYLQNPVTIECGHNFCHECLTQFWLESEKEATCPQCRIVIQQRNMNPNWQLARFVEITQKLSHQVRRKKEGTRWDCEKHQEPLKLFCKEDETPICVVCDRSKEHRNHEVVPAEEAAEEYEFLICTQLELLRRKKQKILVDIGEAEVESQHLLKITENERRKTVAQFQEIHQFLEEQEKLLLSQMDEVKKEILRQSDEHRSRLSRELASVEGIIQELKEKRQQTASELLKDVQNTLQRSEVKIAVFENPVAFSPELKWRIWDFCDLNPLFYGLMEKFKKALLHGQQLEKESVTLDPDTAHPQLILSEGCKSVRWGDKSQDRPKNPERFDTRPFVLGRERFTTGRHFWEVMVEGEEAWAVGVVRKSIRRKGLVEFGPEEGMWAIGKWNDEYRSIKPPKNPLVLLQSEPTKIRVTLNYGGQRVAFFDADTGDLLYAFSETSFCGETLHPYFCVIRKASLSISS